MDDNQLMQFDRIYLDIDVVGQGQVDVVRAWLREHQQLVDDPDEEALNISSKSVFKELADDEKPPFAFFDVSMLQKMVQGQRFEPSKHVINPGPYKGHQFVMPSPQDRPRPSPLESLPANVPEPSEYTELETAFVLTAIYHHEALLYHRTVVHECITQTLAVFAGRIKGVYKRTRLSVHEKVKVLMQKASQSTWVHMAVMKKPLLQHPELMEEFVLKLADFEQGQLEITGLAKGFQVRLNQRDVHQMLVTAQWEYPPGTELRRINKDFREYYGPVHSGKPIQQESWLEMFRRRCLTHSYKKEHVIGKHYSKLRTAGLTVSDIAGGGGGGGGGSGQTAQRGQPVSLTAEQEFDMFFNDG